MKDVYRITCEDDRFYVERKGWFGWVNAVRKPQVFGYTPISFSTYEAAKTHLNGIIEKKPKTVLFQTEPQR